MSDDLRSNLGPRRRRRSWLLVLACAWMGSMNASAALPPSAAPAATAGGVLEFKTLKHDFGRVFDIKELVCHFEFQNSGNEIVTIKGVKASCGCTTPTLSRETFGPGESDVLEARWDPAGLGRQSKTITVRSDALPGGVAILTISAEITPFVKMSPSIVKFGNIKMGESHTARVTFHSHDPNWEIMGVRTRHDHVQASVVEELTNGRKVIEVVATPGLPWGFLTTKVYVDVLGRTDPEGELIPHTAELTVTGTLVGEVGISAPMFSIGKITPGPFQAEILLSRPAGGTFEVVDVHVGPKAPPVNLQVRAEKSTENGSFVQRLILSGDTGDYLGYLSGTVVFATDVAGEEPRTLRFGGNAVAK